MLTPGKILASVHTSPLPVIPPPRNYISPSLVDLCQCCTCEFPHNCVNGLHEHTLCRSTPFTHTSCSHALVFVRHVTMLYVFSPADPAWCKSNHCSHRDQRTARRLSSRRGEVLLPSVQNKIHLLAQCECIPRTRKDRNRNIWPKRV